MLIMYAVFSMPYINLIFLKPSNDFVFEEKKSHDEILEYPVLEEFGVCSNFISVIKYLYTDSVTSLNVNSYQINLGKSVSWPFNISCNLAVQSPFQVSERS